LIHKVNIKVNIQT